MALDSTAAKAQDTYLSIGTGAGSPVSLTSLALTSPIIITEVAHGFSNGDIVTLAAFTGADAADINKVWVAQNVTDDTFSINLDGTTRTITIGSATATAVTLTEVGSVVDINKNDPGSNEIDTTHLRSTAKEFIFGLVDSGDYTLTINYSFSDTAQVAMKTAQVASTSIECQVTYPEGDTIAFTAYVTTFNGPGAAVDGILTGDVTLRITGAVNITPA